MKTEPIVIELTYNAPVSKVWKAITNKNDMKQWYFDLTEFKPEVGFEFTFTGGKDGREYLHVCKIAEVIPNKKLKHTWKYAGFEGMSYVTWELFDEDRKTRVKLTHEGLEAFPQNNPDFARKNFVQGWTEITGKNLKEFVERP